MKSSLFKNGELAAKDVEDKLAPLNLHQEIALTIYLEVYKLLIKSLKPSMGLLVLSESFVIQSLDVILSGDLVIDISSAIKPTTPRPTVRSYISGASTANKAAILAHMDDILRSPKTPAYFKGFRTVLSKTIIAKVAKKQWGMGAVTMQPTMHMNELGLSVVYGTPRFYMRLR